MKLFFSAFLFSALTPLALGRAGWSFSTIESKLPKALSDHTASVASNGKVYIAGGCDDENGNSWNAEAKSFYCNDISDSFYSFDLKTQQFEELKNLPHERYRHSSAVFDNKVWITGGRSLTEPSYDELVPEIDVYDIATGNWSTVGNLPLEYQVSDHASFAKDAVYIAGGYTMKNKTQEDGTFKLDYHAVNTVLKIESGTQFSTVKPLSQARGDIIGVASDDGTSAFVAGGWSHENWCSPFNSAEKYSFNTDTWTDLTSFDTARGEIVLVESENHLYSLGGEYAVEKICIDGETIPGTKTVGTDKVEILMDGETKWETLESFPEQLFRFAAVGTPEKDAIYVFGGQTAYMDSCKCTKTSNHVWIFEKKEGSSAPGSLTSLATAFLAGALSFVMIYV